MTVVRVKQLRRQDVIEWMCEDLVVRFARVIEIRHDRQMFYDVQTRQHFDSSRWHLTVRVLETDQLDLGDGIWFVDNDVFNVVCKGTN